MKLKTALNVLLFVSNHIVLLTARLPSPSVKPYAKNQNVTGNATNPTAQNPNVNSSARTPTVSLRLNAVLALWEVPESLLPSPSSRKLLLTKNAVLARRTNY